MAVMLTLTYPEPKPKPKPKPEPNPHLNPNSKPNPNPKRDPSPLQGAEGHTLHGGAVTEAGEPAWLLAHHYSHGQMCSRVGQG